MCDTFVVSDFGSDHHGTTQIKHGGRSLWHEQPPIHTYNTSSNFFISYKTTGHCLGQRFFSFLSSTCEFQIRARSTLFTYWLKPFFLGEDYSHELESLSKESSILLKTILGDNTFYFQMRYKSFCFSKKYLINFKRSQSILVGSSINLVFVK